MFCNRMRSKAIFGVSGDKSKMPKSTKINFSRVPHCQSTCVYTDSECEGGSERTAGLVETSFAEAEGGARNVTGALL